MNLIKKIYYEKYTKKSYSISNVDLIIDRMFASKDNGIYIDIGCNHPIKYNNTYLLHKRGWSGINIDLDKKSIDEFKKFRPNDYNIEALISEKKDEKKDVYFYHDRSAINTVNKELAIGRNKKYQKVVRKTTTTINNVIENLPFKNTKIDLISIDIESHEYEALRNFDFEKYKPDIIVTECHDITQKELEVYNQSIEFILETKLYKLLTSQKYKLINWVNSDLIFSRNN